MWSSKFPTALPQWIKNAWFCRGGTAVPSLVLVSRLDDEGCDKPEGAANQDRQRKQGATEAVLRPQDKSADEEKQASCDKPGHCAENTPSYPPSSEGHELLNSKSNATLLLLYYYYYIL
jgi:hypothetical protein